MKQFFQQKLNRVIEHKFDYSFSVPDDGIYFVEINALAKNWRQNLVKFRSFLGADNLAVKIDDVGFISNAKKRNDLRNNAAAWNGNILKGYSKTNVFALSLQSGNHILHFSSTQTPLLESIQVYQIEDGEKVSFNSFSNQDTDSNRRLLIAFILLDLEIYIIDIIAKAKQGGNFLLFKRDDSDLQLIINGEIQRNDEPKAHKQWYWCGRTLKGNSKIFSKKLNLERKSHSIELLADRNPEIESVFFTLGPFESKQKIEFSISDVRPYSHRGVNNDEDYNRFDLEIVMAANKWNKYFFAQEYPPTEPLHPNLVKAMIYIESRMGYQVVRDGYYPAYPDIMQVGDPRNPAIHTLNHDGWIDPITRKEVKEYEFMEGKIEILNYHGEANIHTTQDSIIWGVRWLYHKAQGVTKDGKRYWKTWNEAVRNYNGEGNLDYEKEVYDVYENKEDRRDKGNLIKLWTYIFILFSFLTSGLIFGFLVYKEQGIAWLSFENTQEDGRKYILTANITSGLRVKRQKIYSYDIDEKNYQINYHSMPRENELWLERQNIFGDSKDEFIITGDNRGGATIRYVLKQTARGLETVSNIGESGNKNKAFRGDDIEFVDVDNDGIMEARELFYELWQGRPYKIFRSWYLYNETSGAYVFYKKDQVDKDHPEKETIFLW